ncbi:MAG TPA: hypothetical protein VJ962_05830 [Clostridia bacterium]|nr:hypothetical protein [Clostridia bacterium]
MSEINIKVKEETIEFIDKNYQTMAKFRVSIHNMPISNYEYNQIKNLLETAPELLEVAEMLLHEYNYYHIAEEEHTRQIFEKAKKVVAKAKGEIIDETT